jgi:hypothetical protein
MRITKTARLITLLLAQTAQLVVLSLDKELLLCGSRVVLIVLIWSETPICSQFAKTFIHTLLLVRQGYKFSHHLVVCITTRRILLPNVFRIYLLVKLALSL